VKKYVIIVAGGTGNRFEGPIPKQFVELCGKPVIMHSIEAFYHYNSDIEIIVVLPENQIEYWKLLCVKFHFVINHKTITGGKERFFSVKNGLKYVSRVALVAIHDGVRPLIDFKTIDSCFKMAELEGNAIPVIELTDSVREIKSDRSSLHVDRKKFRLIQTPQVFQTPLILKAFEQEFSYSFTDDASVLEAMVPNSIKLVDGNKQNIKITTKEDLLYAEAILKSRMV
jgi:2-C-methyl-D-erythritol 4-phosphate cytidylyltransferase